MFPYQYKINVCIVERACERYVYMSLRDVYRLC